MESREPRAESEEQSDPNPREGWSEALRAMAEAGDDKLVDEPAPTKFDEEEWEWEGLQ